MKLGQLDEGNAAQVAAATPPATPSPTPADARHADDARQHRRRRSA